MRRLVTAACFALLLAGSAQAQTLSGSQIPATVPTLHQFGSAESSASYLAGQVECGAGALTASVPIGCLNTDWLWVQSADASLSTFFQIGGTWAAGDQIGINAWLATGTGSYTEYSVSYTVQSGDISGGGNSLATYQNILAGLAGTDQSGQGAGGCINGTGGYGPGSQVPSAPAHCSGTSALLTALENFPDTGPIAGNGYRPQAFAQCGSTGSCYLAMNFPWGNALSGGFASHPAVNLILPSKTSASGTFTTVQQRASSIQNQIFSSGNTLDNGPVLGVYRLTNGNNPLASTIGNRPDVVGDMLSRLDLGNSQIFSEIRGATGQASTGYTSGTTIVLSASPTMPPSMTLPSGGGTSLYVQDATTACAIPPQTTLAGWNGGTNTITLSQPVNGTAPCPGIANGDLISITDFINSHVELAFAPSYAAGPVLFLGDGLRTTDVTGPNGTCRGDPGYGNAVICGAILGDTYALGMEGQVLSDSDTTDAVLRGVGLLKLWGGNRSQTPADLQIGTDGGVTVGNATDKGAGAIDAIAVYAGGAQLLPVLAGTSGNIGGSSLGAGTCTSGTVSISGATTSMAVAASPASYPGDGFGWRGYVSSSGTVTIKVCNDTSGALTPTASAYNVRVLQ
jgi:hypothetical protein